MPTILNSSKTATGKNLLPVTAMFIGILSGPISFGVMVFVDHQHIKGDMGLLAILASFLGVFAIAATFAITVRARLVMSRRDKGFTNIGIAAAIIWGIIFLIAFGCGVSQIPMG